MICNSYTPDCYGHLRKPPAITNGQNQGVPIMMKLVEGEKNMAIKDGTCTGNCLDPAAYYEPREDQPFQIGQTKDKRFGPVPPADPELAQILDTIPTTDKNTKESLRALRWHIYEIIDDYSGDIGKAIRGCLKQEVEQLFKKYTNS